MDLPLSALFRQDHSQLVARFRASPGLFSDGRERAGNPATGWLCWEAAANVSLQTNSFISGKIQGIHLKSVRLAPLNLSVRRALRVKFPVRGTGKFGSEQGVLFKATGLTLPLSDFATNVYID